jgi:hypothetical protein
LLDQKGSINFSKLANARLTYTTFLASARDVLSPADLQRLLTPAPAAGAAAATTPAAGAAAPAGTAAATGTAGTTATGAAAPAAGGTAATSAQTGLTIPEARKKELLLLYLNRLIDVVFSQ